jgi:hypothetical protein
VRVRERKREKRKNEREREEERMRERERERKKESVCVTPREQKSGMSLEERRGRFFSQIFVSGRVCLRWSRMRRKLKAWNPFHRSRGPL